MVSNTQRIEALEKRVGELDGLDERVRDLSSASQDSGSSDANNCIAALEKENDVLLSRIIALEKRNTPTSTSVSPRWEERIVAVERMLKEQEVSINDTTEDCREAVGVLREEMAELSAKVNLTMRAVGNAPATGPIGMEYG